MDMYRHEQYVSDREIGNPTGLLYEGGTIVDLVKLFERIPGLEEREIPLFLVTSSFVLECFSTWTLSSLQIVKTLKNRAARIQVTLEEDKFQNKDQASSPLMAYETKRLRDRMNQTKRLNIFHPKKLFPTGGVESSVSKVTRYRGFWNIIGRQTFGSCRTS